MVLVKELKKEEEMLPIVASMLVITPFEIGWLTDLGLNYM